MDRIGVIGQGRMGSAMAARMAAQGAEVAGWTRSGVSAADAAAMGITASASLAELVERSDALVLSLFDDASVRDVVGQLCDFDLTGRIVIDTSTVSPKLLAGLAPGLAAKGAQAADAPISGGPEMVSAGTCGVFIGGDDHAAARAKQVAELFAARVFHIGPTGAGMGMKAANNMLIAGYMAALSEVLQLAKLSGIPKETALNVLAGGPIGAPWFKDRISRILGEDQSVGFALSGAAKDVGVILAVADEIGIEAPVAGRAGALFAAAAQAGYADHDVAKLCALSWDQA